MSTTVFSLLLPAFLESFHRITMVEKKEHFVLCCKERTLIYWKSTSLEAEKRRTLLHQQDQPLAFSKGKRSFRGVIHKCKRGSCSHIHIKTQFRVNLDQTISFSFFCKVTSLRYEMRISDCKSILIVDRLHGVLAKNSERKLKID